MEITNTKQEQQTQMKNAKEESKKNVDYQFKLPPLFSNLWLSQKERLSKKIENFASLKNLIQTNRQEKAAKQHMGKLKKIFNLEEAIQDVEKELKVSFYKDILPIMQTVALDCEKLFKDTNFTIKRMVKQQDYELFLTRKQILCILSLQFFECLNYKDQDPTKSSIYGSAQLDSLYDDEDTIALEKLKCLICYFSFAKMIVESTEKVGFFRKVQKKPPTWESYTEVQLTRNISINTDKRIEQTDSLYQVDFANCRLHVHAIIPSLTQEEVMFTIRPECYIGLLISDQLDINEAILISGSYTYCKYTGYQETFQFKGVSDEMLKVKNQQPVDASSIIAIDANFEPFKQFEIAYINRDLNKALIGFQALDQELQLEKIKKPQTLNPSKVSTGQWGCGVFGGDLSLKFIQQMLAAQIANKDLEFAVSKKGKMDEPLLAMYQMFKSKHYTVAQIYECLISYQPYFKEVEFYNYVMKKYKWQ